MTLSTAINTKTYTGDASTTAFSFPYLFYANTDLVVKLDGVTKTINTDYTVTGAENPAGGTVTFLSAPGSGVAIVIQRIVAYKQETDFENFDGNPADVTEKQFDLVVMQSQQLAEQTARAILAPIGTSLTTNTITGTISATTQILTITTAGPSVSAISDLSSSLDTIITSVTANDFLQYNGSAWVNRAEPLIQNMQASGSAGIILQNSGGTTVATTGPTNTTNITFAGVVNNTGSLNVAGTSSAAASISLAEDTDNGTNTVTIIAPSAVTSNRTLTLPDASGTVALTSDITAAGFRTNGTASTIYTMGKNAQNGSSHVAVAGRLSFSPFDHGSSIVIDTVSIQVDTAAGGSSARLGIYALTDGLPGALLQDLGTVSTATTGVKSITGIGLTVNQPICVAFVSNGTPTLSGMRMGDEDCATYLGIATPGSAAYMGGYKSHTYGALPDPFGGSITYVATSAAAALTPVAFWIREA